MKWKFPFPCPQAMQLPGVHESTRLKDFYSQMQYKGIFPAILLLNLPLDNHIVGRAKSFDITSVPLEIIQNVCIAYIDNNI